MIRCVSGVELICHVLLVVLIIMCQAWMCAPRQLTVTPPMGVTETVAVSKVILGVMCYSFLLLISGHIDSVAIALGTHTKCNCSAIKSTLMLLIFCQRYVRLIIDFSIEVILSDGVLNSRGVFNFLLPHECK